MALHPDFPKSPHIRLDPALSWFPADEVLRESSYEKLLPPLVHQAMSPRARLPDELTTLAEYMRTPVITLPPSDTILF